MSQQIKEKVNIVRIYQVERSTLIKIISYLFVLIWIQINTPYANEQNIKELVQKRDSLIEKETLLKDELSRQESFTPLYIKFEKKIQLKIK